MRRGSELMSSYEFCFLNYYHDFLLIITIVYYSIIMVIIS